MIDMNKHQEESRLDKTWILIPAYNEASSIERVIQDLQQHGFFNILVVNDGSKDSTKLIAQNAGAEVLSHVLNRGQGAALRTGLNYLREKYHPKVIVTFDADGQHLARNIQGLIKPVFDGTADIVLGSRFLKGNDSVPPLRKIILKLGVLFTNTVSNIRLTDTHNGLRAIGTKAYDRIQIYNRGMEHASEIIDEISRHRLRYQEYPVEIIYSEYSIYKGQRTSNFIKIAIKMILKKLL